MVSGFFTSPKDHERIRSGEARAILIASKSSDWRCWLKRFSRSFILFLRVGGKSGVVGVAGNGREAGQRLRATGSGSHHSSSSMLMASERISLTRTLKDSG